MGKVPLDWQKITSTGSVTVIVVISPLTYDADLHYRFLHFSVSGDMLGIWRSGAVVHYLSVTPKPEPGLQSSRFAREKATTPTTEEYNPSTTITVKSTATPVLSWPSLEACFRPGSRRFL